MHWKINFVVKVILSSSSPLYGISINWYIYPRGQFFWIIIFPTNFRHAEALCRGIVAILSNPNQFSVYNCFIKTVWGVWGRQFYRVTNSNTLTKNVFSMHIFFYAKLNWVWVNNNRTILRLFSDSSNILAQLVRHNVCWMINNLYFAPFFG